MSTVFASITTPGPAGPPGRTALWLTGTVPPVTAQGLDGDMYLNSTTGDVYGPKSATWGGIVANIKGSAGVAGPTGPAGYSPRYIVQAGTPNPVTGNDGDMYLNSNTSDLYGPKTAGAWGGIVANIKGATGPAGPPGVAYTPRGAWSAATTYVQGDMVTDANIIYIALQSANTGHTPLTSPTWWQPATSGGGGSQTPWLSNIDAAGFQLSNAGAIGIGAAGAPPQPLWVSKNGGGAQAVAAQFTDPSTASGVGPLSAFITLNNHSATSPGAVFTGVNSVALAVGDGSNSDSQRKLVITTAGNVGIGTTAPAATLHVKRGADSTDAILVSGVDDGKYMSLQSAPAYGTIQHWNGSGLGNVVIVPNGGNVGIGTASPGAVLDVNNNGGSVSVLLRLQNDNNYKFDISRSYVTGALSIQGSQVGFNNILLCPTSGKVGIGTASPGYALDVAGDINCTGTFRVNGTPISAGGVTVRSTVIGGGITRAVGTVYRNTFGKPLMITVSVLIIAGATYALNTDASATPTTVAASSSGNAGVVCPCLTCWVLPNHYYSASVSSGATTIYSWNEWY